MIIELMLYGVGHVIRFFFELISLILQQKKIYKDI